MHGPLQEVFVALLIEFGAAFAFLAAQQRLTAAAVRSPTSVFALGGLFIGLAVILVAKSTTEVRVIPIVLNIPVPFVQIHQVELQVGQLPLPSVILLVVILVFSGSLTNISPLSEYSRVPDRHHRLNRRWGERWPGVQIAAFERAIDFLVVGTMSAYYIKSFLLPAPALWNHGYAPHVFMLRALPFVIMWITCKGTAMSWRLQLGSADPVSTRRSLQFVGLLILLGLMMYAATFVLWLE